jgi:hypothetical protein
MKIFEPLPAGGFELVRPATSDYPELRARIAAHVPGGTWHPEPLTLVREDEAGKKLEPSDAPWLDSYSLVLRPAAVLAMKPVLDPEDQLLPMVSGTDELHVLSPKWTIDALDEPASDVWRFPDGSLSYIRKHAFKADAIAPTLAAFRVSRLRVSPIYVTETFARAWEVGKLRGLRFKLLWAGP